MGMFLCVIVTGYNKVDTYDFDKWWDITRGYHG